MNNNADMVNHPSHYLQYTHEVIELTSLCGFCLGNAVKYILRADFKGRRAEDLKKAAWYVNYMNSMALDDIIEQINPDAFSEDWFDKLVESYGNPVVERLIYACSRGNRSAIEEVHRDLLTIAAEEAD